MRKCRMEKEKKKKVSTSDALLEKDDKHEEIQNGEREEEETPSDALLEEDDKNDKTQNRKRKEGERLTF